MASRSLSPKRLAERMQQHRHAVMVLARQSAKRTAISHLRAQGLKPANFTARQITELAEVEFERNRAQLIAEAEHLIETWPGLAYLRCAELINSVQSQEPCSDKTIAVQKLGAE
jgi:hypothetical protein